MFVTGMIVHEVPPEVINRAMKTANECLEWPQRSLD